MYVQLQHNNTVHTVTQVPKLPKLPQDPHDPTPLANMATLSAALAHLSTSWGHLGALAATPLTASLALLAALISFTLVAGTATGWWSWVDRVWSLSPAAYVVLFAALAPAPSPRLALMAALACLWAARLTYNFARKGGFGAVTPENEDYRWPWVRAWMAARLPAAALPLAREAFHVLFVCCYQNVLLWLQVVPACMVVAAHAPTAALGPWDALAAGAFLALLALEALADETQWAFQARKHALSPAQRRAAGGDLARGFCTSGVFAVSRHANFFAEQGMWWAFWGFSLAVRAPGSVREAAAHYSVAGPLLLSLLFQGSTTLTEAITVSKYPAYSAYQARVSRLVPWFPAAGAAGEGEAAPAPAPAAAPKGRSASAQRQR
jgi:steroid 5-alpha reductase family enzyme